MFRSANLQALTKFNSAISSKFVEKYENYLSDLCQAPTEPSYPAFAPSSFRCDRYQWFRLRGVQPDPLSNPSVSLDFMARLGTDIHRDVQTHLSDLLGDDWVDVESYVNHYVTNHEVQITKNGLEYKIFLKDVPIRFACDGIIRINDRFYILEIKTSDTGSFCDLTDPKPNHIDQVRCYSTYLHIDDILFLYVDRSYGNMKCFEHHVTLSEQTQVMQKVEDIRKAAEYNLAPDRLPQTDYMCTNCKYKQKCKSWG